MEIVYSSKKVEKQCTSVKEANKLFGGNKQLTTSLMSRINAIKQAETIMDIIAMPTFHFHKLNNKGKKKLEGYFAIDVKSRNHPWRIILEPLDKNKNPFKLYNIDEIGPHVRIVKIMEVSKHYE